VTGITADTAIPGEIAVRFSKWRTQAREEHMNTTHKVISDVDPDMRLLQDEELDVVIGGVSGGGCFHLPQVLSVLTSVAGGADTISTGISAVA
jgi:hypothetical protein